MIDEFDTLARNNDFRSGVFTGLVISVVIVISVMLVLRLRPRVALVAVTGVGLAAVLILFERREDVERLVKNPSFRWGLLGGGLAVTAVAVCLWSISRRHWVLAGAMVGVVAAMLLSIGYRSGLDDLAENGAFHRSLVVGLIVAVALSAAALLAHRRLAWAAIAICATGFVSFAVTDRRPERFGMLIAACGLLGLAGLVVRRASPRVPTRFLAFAPGALAIALVVNATEPLRSAVLAAVAVLAVTCASSGRLSTQWFGEPVLLAISFGGVYVCVPETALAALLLGAALPFLLTGWPLNLATNGPMIPAIVGIVVWIAFIGGHARDGAVVGAIACLGVLPILPLIGRIREEVPLAAVVLLHLLLVLWCSRVAGLEQGALPALAIAMVGEAATVGALAAIARRAK